MVNDTWVSVVIDSIFSEFHFSASPLVQGKWTHMSNVIDRLEQCLRWWREGEFLAELQGTLQSSSEGIPWKGGVITSGASGHLHHLWVFYPLLSQRREDEFGVKVDWRLVWLCQSQNKLFQRSISKWLENGKRRWAALFPSLLYFFHFVRAQFSEMGL